MSLSELINLLIDIEAHEGDIEVRAQVARYKPGDDVDFELLVNDGLGTAE